MNDYDIIIVGAGPAGAQCARHIAQNSNHSILLLDKTQEIGEPKKSTAGTFEPFLKQYELPKSIVMRRSRETIFESPNEQAHLPIDGYVLDFAKLKQQLAKEAVKNGVHLQIESTVTRPIQEQGKTVGVEYRNLEGVQQARGKIVVDATGPTAVLATQLGLRKLKPENHGIAMEYEMQEVPHKIDHTWLIKFGRHVAPGGYSWIFSTGKKEAKVGVCWYLKHFKKHNGNGSLVTYLDAWIKRDKRLTGGVPFEVHAGDAYVDIDVKRRTADNFLAIGDAVSTVDPFLGEGIRPGMHCGTIAADTILNALKAGNTSRKTLSEYDKKWEETLGHDRKAKLLLTHGIYSLNDKQLDKSMKRLQKYGEELLQKHLTGRMSKMDVLKLLPI